MPVDRHEGMSMSMTKDESRIHVCVVDVYPGTLVYHTTTTLFHTRALFFHARSCI